MRDVPTPGALRAAAEALHPGATGQIIRAWHLPGVGPARFGWALVTATGCVLWLGRTSAEAQLAAAEAAHADLLGRRRTPRSDSQ